MTQERLYFPIFKNTSFIMAELSDEEFGKIVRAAMKDEQGTERPSGFSDGMFMLYKLMKSDAERIYAFRAAKQLVAEKRHTERAQRKAKHASYQSADIDPDDAFLLAVERTFADCDPGEA